MSHEPDFIAQNADLADHDAARAWFKDRTEEFRQKGAKHIRYAWHETIPHLYLVEAWKERPASEGSPRFALVAA